MAIKIQGTTVIDDNRNITSANTAEFNGTSHIKVPSGTDAERPGTPANGMLRYSTTTNSFEGYSAGAWGAIGGGGGGKTNTAIIGDGTSTSFNVSHNLNTANVIIVIKDNTTGYVAYPDIDIIDSNSANIIFYSAPAPSSYSVTVFGF